MISPVLVCGVFDLMEGDSVSDDSVKTILDISFSYILMSVNSI